MKETISKVNRQPSEWEKTIVNETTDKELIPQIHKQLNCGVEKTLKRPLDSKEIQPVHPKGNQSWIVIGRIDAEAETPILWPPDDKNWLIGKDLDPGRDLGQEERGMIEDERAGWYHQLDGHEFEWTPGVDGQGSLACCSLWCLKESDTIERLNWTGLEDL